MRKILFITLALGTVTFGLFSVQSAKADVIYTQTSSNVFWHDIGGFPTYIYPSSTPITNFTAITGLDLVTADNLNCGNATCGVDIIGATRKLINGTGYAASVVGSVSSTNLWHIQFYTPVTIGDISYLGQVSAFVNNAFPHDSDILSYKIANDYYAYTTVYGTINDDCTIPVDVSAARVASGTTITNDFSSWLINSSGTQEGCSYKIIMSYSPDLMGQGITGQNDPLSLTITPDYNPVQVEIHKSINIWNYYNATTTKINYSVSIYDTSNNIILGNEVGSFNLLYSPSSSPVTTPAGFDPSSPCGGVCTNFGTVGSGIGGGSIGTATSTVALAGNKCTAPQNGIFSFFTGEDLAYGFCQTINWLFVPNDTTKGILAGDMNALQAVPPFSWFFATNNAIMAGTQDSAHLTPNLGITYEIAGSSVIATSSVTILPADIASMDVAGGKWSEFINVWFNFVLTALIIMCIIMLYKVAL